MAYMDKKRYKNPTIPTAGRQDTSQPKYDRKAPPPRAPMRAAASMRVASREPREGAPPIPQTQRAPEPETMAAGPVRRAPVSGDTSIRRAAASSMMTPGTTMAPTTPVPTTAAPETPMVLRAPEPEFAPRYAGGGGQGEMPPQQPPAPPTSPFQPEEEPALPGGPQAPGLPGMGAGVPDLPNTDIISEMPSDPLSVAPPPGVGEDITLNEGIVDQTGDLVEGAEGSFEGLVYVDGYGYVTPDDAAQIKEMQGRRKAKKDFMGEDSGTNIKDLIYDLSDISKDSEAQKAALAGQKSEYLEAVDRMVREGALRRMGSGGAFARGFGTIAGKYATAINATALKNKEIEMNGLSTAISNYVNLHSAELDGDTKKMLADWQIHTDKIAQFHAEINNWLTDTEADSMSNKGYTQLYTLFNDLVLSGEVNPTTGKPWTNADIMDTFYTKRHGKVWWNGVGPDGSFDPGAVEAQLKGIDSDVDRKEILQAMRADLKTKNTDGQYDEALAGLSELIGDAKDDAGSVGGAWSEIKSWF